VPTVRRGPGSAAYFAPVVEPTLTTGIQALTVAARAWLTSQAPVPETPGAVVAGGQIPGPVTGAPATAPAATVPSAAGNAGSP
jgi:hypothetical protein